MSAAASSTAIYYVQRVFLGSLLLCCVLRGTAWSSETYYKLQGLHMRADCGILRFTFACFSFHLPWGLSTGLLYGTGSCVTSLSRLVMGVSAVKWSSGKTCKSGAILRQLLRSWFCFAFLLFEMRTVGRWEIKIDILSKTPGSLAGSRMV